jgi:hypothetical protein
MLLTNALTHPPNQSDVPSRSHFAACGYHYSTFDNEIDVESYSKTLPSFVT